MNTLDIVLVLCAVLYALSGYRQGFIVGSTSTLGLLLGGFLGAVAAPTLLDVFDPGFSVSVAALLIVLAGAFAGQAAGAYGGGQLRRRVTWQPARVVDALGGSALSVVAMLLIAWVLGVAASGAELRALNREVRSSAVLGTVDEALPGADRVLSAFNSLVGSARFPRYLEPFAPERIKAVPAPSSGVAARPGVAAAQPSVVKILGAADDCERTLEGTGFVYETERVMTNAHVVAGVDDPVVDIAGAEHPAEVVYYDPDLDVAVLHVPGLEAPALEFGGPAESEDPAAVLGFPENGPYDVQPARVRDQQTLRSANIYGDDTVLRDAYSIYALVRPGNSGGPLVDVQGDVIGVIFAASITDPNTGYALTSDEVADAARAGLGSTDAVDASECTL